MRRLHIGIIDIVSRGPTRALYARVMNANLASIMPQAIGVWCREEGHDAAFLCYTGFEDLLEELPANVDLVFIGAFTEAAHTAYALSNLFRSKGAITVIGDLTPGATPKTPFGTSTTSWALRTGRHCVPSCKSARNIGQLVSTSQPGSSRKRFQACARAGSSSNRPSRKRPSSNSFPCSAALAVPIRAVSVSMRLSPINPWTSMCSKRI